MPNKSSRKLNKNKLYRQLNKKHELKKLVLKYLTLKVSNLNYLNNLYYFQKYKRSGVSFIKNICIYTSRYRGVSSFFKLSRLKLKQLGTMGLLPGLRKSSW